MKEYHIDFDTVHDSAGFHQLLQQTLELPEWYGCNLDALYDCLTELPQPVRLVLHRWDEDVPFAQGFRDVFLDAAAEDPDFSVEFA
jgi:ribonuclease inhibitor